MMRRSKEWKWKCGSRLILVASLILTFAVNAYCQESNQAVSDDVNKFEDIVVTDRLMKGFEKKLHEEPDPSVF